MGEVIKLKDLFKTDMNRFAHDFPKVRFYECTTLPKEKHKADVIITKWFGWREKDAKEFYFELKGRKTDREKAFNLFLSELISFIKKNIKDLSDEKILNSLFEGNLRVEILKDKSFFVGLFLNSYDFPLKIRIYMTFR